MDENIIDVYEDYGQFVEIDIESLEVIYKKLPLSSQLVNEYNKPSIYVLYICVRFIQQIHEIKKLFPKSALIGFHIKYFWNVN